MHKKSFASDHYAGAYPDILNALIEVNKFKMLFGQNAEIYFVLNSTTANVLSLQAMTRSFHAKYMMNDVVNDFGSAAQRVIGVSQ